MSEQEEIFIQEEIPKKRTRKERSPEQIEVLERARSKRKEYYALQRDSKQKLEEILKGGGTIKEFVKKTKNTYNKCRR